MVRQAWKLLRPVLVASLIAGCGPGHEPIPDRAQVIHIVATEIGVRLDPATVHAGDVYLVLDSPVDGSFSFVERQRAGETAGPLSDDDLARLAAGDTGGTSRGGLDAGGCSDEQDAESRGQMGPCGNVMKVTLRVGKYAILGPVWTEIEFGVDATADPDGFVPPPWMAVLEVLP